MIVPILSGHELLYRMLDSIDYPVDNLIIIDNSGCLPVQQQFPHVGKTSVVRMPTNVGVAASWNLGIKTSPFSPWWMVVNFDVTFEPGTLKKIAKQSGPDILLLGCGEPDWQYRYACFTVGESVVSKIGLWDERFFPAYFEDVDFERRARLAGIAPTVAEDAPFVHEHRGTEKVNGYSIEGTWAWNEALSEAKASRQERWDGPWSLDIRRRNGLASLSASVNGHVPGGLARLVIESSEFHSIYGSPN